MRRTPKEKILAEISDLDGRIREATSILRQLEEERRQWIAALDKVAPGVEVAAVTIPRLGFGMRLTERNLLAVAEAAGRGSDSREVAEFIRQRFGEAHEASIRTLLWRQYHEGLLTKDDDGRYHLSNTGAERWKSIAQKYGLDR